MLSSLKNIFDSVRLYRGKGMKKVFGILFAGSSIFAKHHDFNDVKTINAKLVG